MLLHSPPPLICKPSLLSVSFLTSSTRSRLLPPILRSGRFYSQDRGQSVRSMSSRPSTPSKDVPPKVSPWRFKQPGIIGEFFGEYGPGGFAPIDIGAEFQGGQYRVLRKLGYGSYSTVWLALDNRSVVPLRSSNVPLRYLQGT